MSVQFGFRSGPLGLTAEQAAKTLAELGYDCLELCLEAEDVRPETMTQRRAMGLLWTFAEAGIGLASLSYHADREPLDQRAANQEAAIRVAAWMGAEILVLNAERSIDADASSVGRQWAEHVAHFKRLCAYAEEAEVTLAIEPEPLLVVGSSQDALDLIDAVGSPRLKVNLDVGHAQITDPDLAETVRLLGAQIVHLHLEDIAGRVHKHLPFGQGDIDFAALKAALAEIDYQGPYVVDLFGRDLEPVQVAADALAALRQLFG